jgi:hypothetical protein
VVLAARGATDEAGAQLGTARELFTQMRVPRLVERTLRLRAALTSSPSGS